MDPSVTSLKRPGPFIRYGALQYLYHEYLRAASRRPDVERGRRRRSHSSPLTGPEEKRRASPSSSFRAQNNRKSQRIRFCAWLQSPQRGSWREGSHCRSFRKRAQVTKSSFTTERGRTNLRNGPARPAERAGQRTVQTFYSKLTEF